MGWKNRNPGRSYVWSCIYPSPRARPQNTRTAGSTHRCSRPGVLDRAAIGEATLAACGRQCTCLVDHLHGHWAELQACHQSSPMQSMPVPFKMLALCLGLGLWLVGCYVDWLPTHTA